jgi:hypothetical protein
MGLWLTEKIDEKINSPLEIKSTPHSEATPYHSTRYCNQALLRSAFFPPGFIKEWST